jgi:sRNA-binding carbon storage regulator CsrA
MAGLVLGLNEKETIVISCGKDTITIDLQRKGRAEVQVRINAPKEFAIERTKKKRLIENGNRR